jgi:hypothetical protein
MSFGILFRSALLLRSGPELDDCRTRRFHILDLATCGFECNGFFADHAAAVSRAYILTDRRPDQFASTEGTEVYLNTSFSDWCVPIFLVHEKETCSPFVCHPHNPKAALRVEQLFQLATAVVHVSHSECNGDLSTIITDPRSVSRNDVSDGESYQPIKCNASCARPSPLDSSLLTTAFRWIL